MVLAHRAGKGLLLAVGNRVGVREGGRGLDETGDRSCRSHRRPHANMGVLDCCTYFWSTVSARFAEPVRPSGMVSVGVWLNVVATHLDENGGATITPGPVVSGTFRRGSLCTWNGCYLIRVNLESIDSGSALMLHLCICVMGEQPRLVGSVRVSHRPVNFSEERVEQGQNCCGWLGACLIDVTGHA
jgi:hypothetical protein